MSEQEDVIHRMTTGELAEVARAIRLARVHRRGKPRRTGKLVYLPCDAQGNVNLTLLRLRNTMLEAPHGAERAVAELEYHAAICDLLLEEEVPSERR